MKAMKHVCTRSNHWMQLTKRNSLVYEIFKKFHIEQSAGQHSKYVGRQFFCYTPQHEEPIWHIHGTRRGTNAQILISFLLA